MAKVATADELVSGKKPVQEVVQIVLDGAVADEWNRAKELTDRLRRTVELSPNDESLREQLYEAEAKQDELEPKVQDATREVRLQAIGRDPMRMLIEKHPATQEQTRTARKEAKDPKLELQWNSDSFPVALIAASLVEPELTEDQVQDIWDSPNYNEAELNKLWLTALSVNTTSKVASLGND